MTTLQEAVRSPDSEPTTDIAKSVGQRYEGLVPFTEKQSELIHKFRMLSEEVFAPKAIEYDRNPRPQTENFEALHKEGLMGLVVPKEFGGHGADYKTFAFCVAETAYGDRSTALILMMNYVTNYIFDKIGTDEQRKRFNEEAVHKGFLTATATSEGQHLNDDVVKLDTRFTPTDNGYRVQGTKRFLSAGPFADRFSIIGEGPDGFMLAVVYKDNNINPGTIESIEEEPWDPHGMRATMSGTMNFDVDVPTRNIIGRPNEVFESGLFRLFPLGQAAVALGSAMKARNILVAHLKGEGKEIPERLFPQLTDISTGIQNMITSLASTSDVFTNEYPHLITPAIYRSKLYCAQTAAKIASQAFQLGGGHAYARRGDLAELDLIHRDASALLIMPPNQARAEKVIASLELGIQGVKPLGFARS